MFKVEGAGAVGVDGVEGGVLLEWKARVEVIFKTRWGGGELGGKARLVGSRGRRFGGKSGKARLVCDGYLV